MKTKVFGREIEVDHDWRCGARGYPDHDRQQAPSRSGAPITPEAWQIVTHLRRERIAHDIPQSELAKLAGLAVGQLRDYEAGRSEPSIGKVVRWAKALGLNSLDLPY